MRHLPLIQAEILGVINAYILPYCKKYWGCCGSPSSAAPGAASHLSLYSILAIALSSEVMIYSLCTTFASGRIEMTRARANRDVFLCLFNTMRMQRSGGAEDATATGYSVETATELWAVT